MDDKSSNFSSLKGECFILAETFPWKKAFNWLSFVYHEFE
jgi:hypothetical protein